MARLTPVSWRELVKRFRKLGFDGPYAGGRHPQMRRGNVTRHASVARNHSEPA